MMLKANNGNLTPYQYVDLPILIRDGNILKNVWVETDKGTSATAVLNSTTGYYHARDISDYDLITLGLHERRPSFLRVLILIILIAGTLSLPYIFASMTPEKAEYFYANAPKFIAKPFYSLYLAYEDTYYFYNKIIDAKEAGDDSKVNLYNVLDILYIYPRSFYETTGSPKFLFVPIAIFFIIPYLFKRRKWKKKTKKMIDELTLSCTSRIRLSTDNVCYVENY
ncbi:MAG: hypothetical protein PQJ46_11685 [Spirochaetales bacterium]|nr:hypothetical protein [Spirochaetales bacterium]